MIWVQTEHYLLLPVASAGVRCMWFGCTNSCRCSWISWKVGSSEVCLLVAKRVGVFLKNEIKTLDALLPILEFRWRRWDRILAPGILLHLHFTLIPNKQSSNGRYGPVKTCKYWVVYTSNIYTMYTVYILGLQLIGIYYCTCNVMSQVKFNMSNRDEWRKFFWSWKYYHVHASLGIKASFLMGHKSS